MFDVYYINNVINFRRLVSSEDTGVDEAQVQSLLKKHKDVTDELKHYANVIQQLKQQVSKHIHYFAKTFLNSKMIFINNQF